MELNSIKPALGATKNRKRIGRGPGSGHGKTATKGHKGQKARSGGSIKAGFEGGQMPMQRRLPKRGFNPLNRIEYSQVNIGKLNIFDANTTVDIEVLVKSGLVRKVRSGLKILATGDLTKPLTIKANKFSAAAKEKIIAVGGTAEEINP
jgi:large subunit ribosomal protein L15